jgi:hypothetical protein
VSINRNRNGCDVLVTALPGTNELALGFQACEINARADGLPRLKSDAESLLVLQCAKRLIRMDRL